jgi:hypothetical protein
MSEQSEKNEALPWRGKGAVTGLIRTSIMGVVTFIISGAIGAATAGIESFYGLCNASAVAALDGRHFAVADDEDNWLRIFRRGCENPVWETEVSPFIHALGQRSECDIEGAAQVGNRIYWIASHGTDAEGHYAPARHRFFATDIVATNGSFMLRPVGQPYRTMLTDLLANPAYRQFELAAASRLPPKSPGGLNIEGLCATPEGHLLIGFRNPIPDGKALVARLYNPHAILAGQRATFGPPRLLDLGGLGIRSITETPKGYYLIGGSSKGGGKSQLFAWEKNSMDPVRIEAEVLSGLNPEGLAFFATDDFTGLLVVSDDGEKKASGKRHRNAMSPALKQFRSAWVAIHK